MSKYYSLQTPFLTKIIIKRGNKFLLLKDIDSDQENNKKGWETVGGHIEKGEDFTQSLNREILEETGLTDVKILFPIHAFLFYPDTEKTLGGIIYLGESSSDEVKLDLKEHSKAQWFTLEEIKELSESRGTQIEFTAYNNFLEIMSVNKKFGKTES